MTTIQEPTDQTGQKTAQNPDAKAGNVICPRCHNHWGGMNTCHCAGCHETFTGITAFDAHRKAGTCNDPTTVGLELNDRAYPCWGHPSDPTKPNHWETHA